MTLCQCRGLGKELDKYCIGPWSLKPDAEAIHETLLKEAKFISCHVWIEDHVFGFLLKPNMRAFLTTAT